MPRGIPDCRVEGQNVTPGWANLQTPTIGSDRKLQFQRQCQRPPLPAAVGRHYPPECPQKQTSLSAGQRIDPAWVLRRLRLLKVSPATRRQEVPGASMGFAHGRHDDKSRRPDWHRACQVAGFRASTSFPNCPRPAPAVPVAAIYSGRRARCPWLEAREKREARRASARQWDRKGALGHEGNAGTVRSGITP